MDKEQNLLEMLEGGNSSQEKQQAMNNAYRSVFSHSALGRAVLEDMLWELKFLDECQNEKDMALSNYAKHLIVKVYGQEMETHKLTRIINRVLKRKRK